MRKPPRLPNVTLPETARSPRGFLFSVAMHGLLAVTLLWHAAESVETGEAPADGITAGGGGGGGGPRITYVSLAPVQSAAAPVETVVEEVPPPPVYVPRPVLTVRDIPRQVTPLQRVPQARPIPMAKAIGSGAGLSGGPGSGLGTGGGIGSGEGTGTGSGRGPGVGGAGGSVFPPTVRYTFLPPAPTPEELKGQSFQVRFTVGIDGRVIRVSVEPRMADAAYRRKFIDVMERYRFNPAIRSDGTAVRGEAVISVTL